MKESAEIKEILLKRYDWVIRNIYTEKYIADMRIDVNEHDAMAGMVARIHAVVYGEVHKDAMVRYPRNWKESFKERWFPKWLLKRFPVDYRTVIMEAVTFYPEVSFPDKAHNTIIHKMDY